MERRPEHDATVRQGRGRPLSREAAAAVWRAVTSRDAVADWTRYRVLTMALSLALAIWCLGRVVSLVAVSPGAGLDGAGLQIGVVDDAENGKRTRVGPGSGSARLRSDLFEVPTPRRNRPRKEPRTNPVELLSLIELQGVMGGARPRAMILYKRTRETVTVSVGDDLGEFEVMEIRERSVVLKWRNELFELSL